MCDQDLSAKMFRLPEYQYALWQFVHVSVRELMEAKDELFASIRKVDAGESVAVSQNTTPEGEAVLTEPSVIEHPFVFTFEQTRAFDIDALVIQIDVAAEANLKAVMTNMFQTIARISNAFGTATNAGGRPLDHDTLLEALDKLEIAFNEDGTPRMPTLVVHPDVAARIALLPPQTEKQEATFKALIERKRAEHNARKRHRKLH